MYSQENATEQTRPEWQPTGPVARTLTLGDALIIGGGLLVFGFSFLPFVAYDSDLSEALFLESRGLDTWFNAWEAQTFMAPLTWFAILASLLAAALGVWRYFGGAHRRLLTFTLPQLQVVLALFATVVLLGYATASRSVVFGDELAEANGNGNSQYYTDGLDLGFGTYLMLVFALVSVVGSFMVLYSAGPRLFTAQPSRPQNSGGSPVA